jgi:hypothetical protein
MGIDWTIMRGIESVTGTDVRRVIVVDVSREGVGWWCEL